MQATTALLAVTSKGASAFERWILPHRRALFTQAQRLTGNITDAEDLVQETLVRAYTRREQLLASETAAAWLYTMQRNLFINLYRRRQKGPVFTELTEERSNLFHRTTATESPETAITRQMECDALLKALAALPVRYREIVYLADVEQRSYQEIAEHMQMPIGTIRSRIARGRERLQRSLYAWRAV